jgi:hypothetical protein
MVLSVFFGLPLARSEFRIQKQSQGRPASGKKGLLRAVLTELGYPLWLGLRLK